ncbi:MAG: hypothetical protein KDD50_15435, partial [Bdellovibrionales bacterium]|nr:hypothetical protein [Bdellovibrionales bacterium]
MRLSGIILLVLISCNNLFAQENQGEQKENDLFRFGFAVGRFLPNRIAGISEIIPTAAARLAYSRKTYYLEASVIGGNAHSVNFYTLLFDARAFIDSISPGFFWIFGLHNMYYKRTNVTYEEV